MEKIYLVWDIIDTLVQVFIYMAIVDGFIKLTSAVWQVAGRIKGLSDENNLTNSPKITDL